MDDAVPPAEDKALHQEASSRARPARDPLSLAETQAALNRLPSAPATIKPPASETQPVQPVRAVQPAVGERPVPVECSEGR